jgi:drug/metabolite transporter (DMT)-like permease
LAGAGVSGGAGTAPVAAGRTRSSPKGIFLVALSSLAFSLMPFFARSVQGYAAAAVVFYRALFSTTLVTAWILLSPALRAQADPRRLPRKTLALLALLGLMLGCAALLYYYSLTRTSVAKAMLLTYTAPIYVVLLGPRLLGERRVRNAGLVVALGVGGMALIVEPARLASFRPEEISGILAAAGSGMALAGVFMLGRALNGRAPAQVRIWSAGAVMMLMYAPWGLTAPAALLWRNLPWVAGLGIVTMALPYILLFKGQALVTAQVSAIVSLLEPVCGIVMAYAIYGEKLSWWGALGAAAIGLSIYLSSQG